MWFDILKNAKTVAQTQGSFDFEEEEIPEEDEQDDCKKWLKGLYDIMNKYQDIDYGHPYANKRGPSENVIKLDKIPENLACAIKDFYTENNAHEIDTSMASLRPYFEKHGVDEKFINDIYIGTYFVDYFQVDILINSDDGFLLHAGPSFSWTFSDGPFKKLYDKIENENEGKPYSKYQPQKEVEERVKQFLKGEDKLSKRIGGFIKEFYEYIKKPEMKDYFKAMFGWAWYNLNRRNNAVESDGYIDKETRDSFENAVEQYL
tara:strand:+ start:3398 stop:4180 length:783 start_codon:yes stop_codon:yes gene_type:complete